ncbi:MAG: hypothetical protein ACRCZH_01175 [Cetobacterium sp.]
MKKNKEILKNNEIKIYFDMNLRKKTQELLSFIILKASTELENRVQLSTKKIMESFKFKDLEELDSYLYELLDFKIQVENKLVYRGTFNVISNYEISEEKINVNISRTFWDKNFSSTGFKDYSLELLIILNEEHIIKLFNLISEYMKKQNSFIVSIEDLKTKMGMEDKYSRENDFIDKILKPALIKINKLNFYDIDIEKIKVFKGYYNILFLKNINLSESQLKMFNKILIDFQDKFEYGRIFKIKIVEFLKRYSEEYIYENIKYAWEHKKEKNFYLFFIEAVEKNLSKYTDAINENILLNKEVKITSKNLFIAQVINDLLKYEITTNFSDLSMKVLKALYSNNKFQMEKNGFNVFCSIEGNIGRLKIEKIF